MRMKRACVFCGSRSGRLPAYAEAAKSLGVELADRGVELVYGGGGIGLMGEVADSVLAAGGRVTGVIPRALMLREQGHGRLTEMRVVDSMHQRKALMGELSDAFIAMPGGLGTMEELFEVVTWAQLGIHAKPCGLLNVGGYFDHLIAFLEHQIEEGFVSPEHRRLFVVEAGPRELLERLESHHPPEVERWLKADQS